MAASGDLAIGRRTATRLDGLDALRGIAALLVAAKHFEHVTLGDGSLFGRGYLAVDLFFVLSGYVMARTYEPKFANGMRLGDFAAIRLKRLWPTMLIGAILGTISFWPGLTPADSLIVFAMAALFIPLVSDSQPQFPTNPPIWSIVLELLANTIHILGLRLLNIRGLVLLAVGCAAWLIASGETMSTGSVGFTGLARVLFSYSAGIVIWRTCGERAVLPGWLGLLALPLAVLLIDLLPGANSLWDFAFILLLCPAIVVSGIAPLRFGLRVLPFLGAISFPLYAIHFPLAMLFGSAGFGMTVSLPLTIVCAWLVSLATSRSWLPKNLRQPLPA